MTDETADRATEARSCTCKVEAIVSIDERGQMVLPKVLRERAGIHAGDKLALVGYEREGSICCISLIKAEALSGVVKDVLGTGFADQK